jgi:hypothetical protein
MCSKYFCDYERYYIDQSGGNLDISYYRAPYQRGAGAFSALFKRYGVPALKYLFKQGMSFGKNLYEDVREGRDVRQAMKSNLRKTLGSTISDLGEKVTQSGKGIRMKPRFGNKRISKSKKAISKSRSVKRKRSFRKPAKRIKYRNKIPTDIFN